MKFVIIVSVILLFITGCYRENDYDRDSNKSESLFAVSVSKLSIPADATSITQFFVSFDKSADSLKGQTLFKTSAGVFVESGGSTYTVIPKYNYDSAKLIASVKLRSTQKVDSAIVVVEVAGFTKTVIVRFIEALPETTELTANTLSIKPKNNAEGEAVFTNKINRIIGLPSLNTTVDMEVKDTLFAPIGSFRIYSNKSDASGLTNYTYVLGDSVANGRKYIGKLYAISRAPLSLSPVIFTRDTLILVSTN